MSFHSEGAASRIESSPSDPSRIVGGTAPRCKAAWSTRLLMRQEERHVNPRGHVMKRVVANSDDGSILALNHVVPALLGASLERSPESLLRRSFSGRCDGAYGEPCQCIAGIPGEVKRRPVRADEPFAIIGDEHRHRHLLELIGNQCDRRLGACQRDAESGHRRSRIKGHG